MDIFSSLLGEIYTTLIAEGRWQFYVEGLKNTLVMTVLASLVGIVIGVLIAVVKTTNAATGKLRFFAWLCNVYTTVIRGTPVLVQLLIFWYVVFIGAPSNMKIFVASLAFGINSGAYVAEIIRAGIQSIDIGQTEAGRSLGLRGGQTMRLIVLPQAVKNILPALFNEMITLLKETSVAGYVALMDITRAGDLIRSRTFAFMPLFVSAGIYLVLVVGLTAIQKRLERRLATSDRR